MNKTSIYLKSLPLWREGSGEIPITLRRLIDGLRHTGVTFRPGFRPKQDLSCMVGSLFVLNINTDLRSLWGALL